MGAGRPTKYDPALIETVRELALDGKTEDEIAAAIGICRTTLWNWKNQHPEFLNALNQWKDSADSKVETSLYEKALNGDVTACIFWLKNRKPREWRDRQEISHDVTDDLKASLLKARSRSA